MIKFSIILGTMVLMAACGSQVKFQDNSIANNGSLGSSPGSPISNSPGGTSATPPGTCPLQNVTIPIKVLFVVDTSGSNNSPTMDNGTYACDGSAPCSPATDPNKTFRGGSISSFFANYQSKSNFSWGFEVFQGSGAQSYINTSMGGSFGDAIAMSSAINQFMNETDSDGTPYLSALSTAQNLIANDPDLHSTAAHPPLYYIIFMSDGYPTDAITTSGSTDLGAIGNYISSIQALAPGRIILSSVYYGTIDDPSAASTLYKMSVAGHGQFADVNTGSVNSIVIDDLIQVPSTNCN